LWRFGEKTAELSEIAESCEVFEISQGCCARDPPE